MTAHEAFRLALEAAAKEMPTTWLDPLLSGDRKVIFESPCPEIEALVDALKYRIRAIPNPYPASEWVKVSERMPDVNATVWCMFKTPRLFAAAVFNGNTWHSPTAAFREYSCPVYWMPLPTPPEGKP